MDQEEGVEVPHLARPPRRQDAGAEPALGPARRGLLAAGILSRRSNANAPARAADAVGGRDGVVAPQDGHVSPPPAGPPPSGRGGYYTRPPPRRRHLPSPSDAVQYLREFRHTPCLMAPAALLVLLAVALTSLVGLALALPRFVLGLLLGPLVRRSYWLVEFVYRHRLAGWGHVRLMEIAGRSGKKKGGGAKEGGNKNKPAGHSATVEQRVEVVPGRVYVHPVPQFVDNLAYLVVCLPPPDTRHLPITAVLVDCGDHASALEHAGAVYRRHYEKEHPRDDGRGEVGIELCAMLCTHRHHDHTAGVRGMVRELTRARAGGESGVAITAGSAGNAAGPDGDDAYASKPGNVVVAGAAIEGVPGCNLFLKDGCFVPLPCASSGGGERNDMNEVVSVEAVACPGHTRGSLVYALRDRPAPGVVVDGGGDANGKKARKWKRPWERPDRTGRHAASSHLFTGDVVFTGGSGVPFEADLERTSDDFLKNPGALGGKHGGSRIRPGAGALSTERCFAEVLVRADGPWRDGSAASHSDGGGAAPGRGALIYPGHEYTTDCLLRQFHPRNVPPGGEWTRCPPSTFFEVASSYFVAAHRRALPAGQRLLTVPTPMARELVVNPNYRSLRRRADHAVRALALWYEYGCRTRLPDDEAGGGGGAGGNGGTRDVGSAPGPPSVFTTVFTSDLDGVVSDLRSSRVDRRSAADRIDALRRRMDDDLVSRRPVPGRLPDHKSVYLGVVALCALGSRPCAATASDASVMGMARPEGGGTDLVPISRRRLLAAVVGLGAVPADSTPRRLGGMLRLLWGESRIGGAGGGGDGAQDPESTSDDGDEIELGLLKHTLFGVGSGMSTTKLCAPCGMPPGFAGGSRPAYDEKSWVTTSRLKRTDGMLVRHDPRRDPACRGVFAAGM